MSICAFRDFICCRFGHQARIPDTRKRFCLQLALENGITWDGGIAQMLKIGSFVLGLRDEMTQFYPFMTAAVLGPGNLRPDINTVFNLLKSNPSVISNDYVII